MNSSYQNMCPVVWGGVGAFRAHGLHNRSAGEWIWVSLIRGANLKRALYDMINPYSFVNLFFVSFRGRGGERARPASQTYPSFFFFMSVT